MFRGFSKLHKVSQFFFFKKFYPSKGDTQYLTRGPIETLSIYWVRKSLELFQKSIGFLRFLKSWKCFIPRREMHSISSRGPFVFTYVLFWGSKSLEHFKTCLLERPFWNRENVLSPEGRYVVYPVGVQLFLLMFYFG